MSMTITIAPGSASENPRHRYGNPVLLELAEFISHDCDGAEVIILDGQGHVAARVGEGAADTGDVELF